MVMKVPDQFSILLKSIGEGTKTLDFKLNEAFFLSHDNLLLGTCEINLQVVINGGPELMEFILTHKGYMETNCDRCLEQIRLPLEGRREFLVKFVDEDQEDEEEILYIKLEEDRYDLGGLINEVITLSLPIVKVYDCQDETEPPCDPEILKFLQRSETSQEESILGAQLKNLKLED